MRFLRGRCNSSPPKLDDLTPLDYFFVATEKSSLQNKRQTISELKDYYIRGNGNLEPKSH